MYSSNVVESNLALITSKGEQLQRRSIEESLTITEALTKLWNPDTLTPSRAFTPKEQAFIRSETILCRFDFLYWANRYGYMEKDASEGIGYAPAKFWPSQDRALQLIASREELNHANYQRYKFAEGIKAVWHKTRQQGATAIARLLTWHRMTTRKNIRAIAASLDETKVHELYVRDKAILDNLPFFLRPKVEFDVKGSHIGLELAKSRITYQQANQKAGVGTGQQFDLSHMTEVALWPDPDRLKFDFFPAIPQALTTFVGFESTANGRNNFWHQFTENVRKHEEGFETWIYIFTPWYINYNKNRRIAIDNWEPNVVTKEMQAVVEKTSHEFVGETIQLTKEQLYWWESEYNQYKKDGDLYLFFSNYPSTPEESFQSNTRSALPIETIQRMRSTSLLGMPYHTELSSLGLLSANN